MRAPAPGIPLRAILRRARLVRICTFLAARAVPLGAGRPPRSAAGPFLPRDPGGPQWADCRLACPPAAPQGPRHSARLRPVPARDRAARRPLLFGGARRPGASLRGNGRSLRDAARRAIRDQAPGKYLQRPARTGPLADPAPRGAGGAGWQRCRPGAVRLVHCQNTLIVLVPRCSDRHAKRGHRPAYPPLHECSRHAALLPRRSRPGAALGRH